MWRHFLCQLYRASPGPGEAAAYLMEDTIISGGNVASSMPHSDKATLGANSSQTFL